jgi:hypothetical protein
MAREKYQGEKGTSRLAHSFSERFQNFRNPVAKF